MLACARNFLKEVANGGYFWGVNWVRGQDYFSLDTSYCLCIFIMNALFLGHSIANSMMCIPGLNEKRQQGLENILPHHLSPSNIPTKTFQPSPSAMQTH